ncbi:unnamed protein product, partial [Meganyctiphanes norvegica]|uniref:Uncharacterized protein n=1 Tax=Meganyctiphanes norvegica TaxID=48144 RepID=A0AAV2S3H1_MEGNR
MTPRNFMDEVLLNLKSRNLIYSGKNGIIFLGDLNIIKENLSILRESLLLGNQEFNSSIIFSPVLIKSWILLPWKKILVSSAKILTLPKGQQFGRSLMNNKKKRGPRTEP